MFGSRQPAATRLALADDPTDVAHAEPWIGPLVALGARTWRYSQTLSNRQLVVVLSVPVRDFAAVLVGAGWAMASPPPVLDAPVEIMRLLESHTPVRVVTDHFVFSGYFTRLDENAHPARALIDGTEWLVTKIRSIAVLSELRSAVRTCRRPLGRVGAIAGFDTGWADRLSQPPADLAIVGTVAWVREDLDTYFGVDGEEGVPAQIADILLPDGEQVATWSTRLYSTAKFASEKPLATEVRAVVLDGSAAIKYLAEIETQIVFAIVDRSVADDTAAEIVVQQRNTRGESVSLDRELDWYAPAGVEAFAFKVPL